MRFPSTRRPVNVFDPDLVEISKMWEDGNLPALVTAKLPGADLATWLSMHRGEVEGLMLRQGGLLFRGFDVRSSPDFARVVKSFSNELLEYTERSTPRSTVERFVYTSTEYPADQSIPLHNENSYAHVWPQHIWFFCERPADACGETTIAGSREVFRLLDAALRTRFMQRKVAYVRNYRAGLGLSWQETFQTQSRSKVDQYCASAGIQCEWTSSRLRTRQVRRAVANHPVTGEAVWFNQAHLFHPSSLPPAVYKSLAATLPEEEFPRHAHYGDGAALEADALDHIRAVYTQAEERVPWKAGDVLLLDNMLIAHGRAPYRGTRRVLVTMAKPRSAVDAPTA